MKTENKQAQKIVEEEMNALLVHRSKEVIIHGFMEGKKIEKTKLLIDVLPYQYIGIWNDGISHLQFIGPNSGILKITDKETGKILYENANLHYNYHEDISSNQKLAHINNMRETKYGTNEYNTTSYCIV